MPMPQSSFIAGEASTAFVLRLNGQAGRRWALGPTSSQGTVRRLGDHCNPAQGLKAKASTQWSHSAIKWLFRELSQHE